MEQLDVHDLKTRIKTWERAFKARTGAEPTKEDVKADRGGIAKYYAAYKKASKVAVQSASSLPSTSKRAASASREGPVASSSKLAPPVALPSRAPSASTLRKHSSSSTSTKTVPPAGAAPLKRKASRTELTTPQKPRATLNIPHASPSNPFLAVHAGPGRDSLDPSSPSRYLYAASPQKLRAALSITPRTRARKRLRGEDVGETPVKERVGRRSWVPASDGEDDDDEQLGPSPAKPVGGFKPLFAAEIRGLGKTSGGDELPFGKKKSVLFARQNGNRPKVGSDEASTKVISPTPSPSPPASPSITTTPLATSPPEYKEPPRPETPPPRTKRITLMAEDGNESEMELIIRPTRDVGRWKAERTPSPPVPSSPDVELQVPPSLLETLSLRSPAPVTAVQKKVDRAVKEIFDPRATRARADQSKLAEEVVGDTDPDLDGAEEEGDDDWESEVEGWKIGGPGEVLSDDGW